MTDNERRDRMETLAKKILECRECSFYEELNGLPFHPDLPERYQPTFRAMVIGINPGFLGEEYSIFQKYYRSSDTEEIRTLLSDSEKDKIYPYQRGLYKTFSLINEELPVFDGNEVTVENIYDYVAWANLSFCASQSTYERKLNDINVPCRVYSEEIHNCLGQGFLSEMIHIVRPRVIVFFANDAFNSIYYKLVLKAIFGLESYKSTKTFERSVPAYQRAGKNINTTIRGAKIPLESSLVKVIMAPHPNYRMTDENRASAIRYVCSELNNIL